MLKGMIIAVVMYAIALITPLYLLAIIPSAHFDYEANNWGIFMSSTYDCGAHECFDEPTAVGHIINILFWMLIGGIIGSYEFQKPKQKK